MSRPAVVAWFCLCFTAELPAQAPQSAEQVLAEADRLAWLRAWTRAEPLFARAEVLYSARADRRNVIYASVGRLRGELPRVPVSEVSERLEVILDDPIVKADDRLRLRCLAIKGETDEDYDPVLAEKSWRQAAEVARRLGDAGWENRANGELGVIAGLLGRTGEAITLIGKAIKSAEITGDVSSQIRWLSIMGMGFVEFGRPEDALKLFDRAITAGSKVDELRYSVMAQLGKISALVKLHRFAEARTLLTQALSVARQRESLGYQAELLINAGRIADAENRTQEAIEKLQEAANLAHQVSANRVGSEAAIDLGRVLRKAGRTRDAERTFEEGIRLARQMKERLLLPRLLTQYAEMAAAEGQRKKALGLVEEATDVVEGLLVGVGSPWVKARLIKVMDEVFVARIRLEGEGTRDPKRMLSVIEQARGRVLADQLMSRPLWSDNKPQAVSEGQQRITALQKQLWTARSREERRAILDKLFFLEYELAPAASVQFWRSRNGQTHRTASLADIQNALRPNELLLEFALGDPASYCVVVSREGARLQRLGGRTEFRALVRDVASAIKESKPLEAASGKLSKVLFASVPEIKSKERLIIAPDDELHRVPFEVLVDEGSLLLQHHAISYVPSATVLSILRNRPTEHPRGVVAVAFAGSDPTPSEIAALGAVSRGVYDVDGGKLPRLASADDEARAVASLLATSPTAVLLTSTATEAEFKRLALDHFGVLHFAAHGILSTKFPDRSAIVLKTSETEDGFLQAREILNLHLNASLVTLSSCEAGAGTIFGQEGVASLVRPFLAAGARTVVANLWAADDTFSLVLMKEFYRQLAIGTDKATALQRAKLSVIKQFGSQATPKLWSGFLLHGDGAGTVTVKH